MATYQTPGFQERQDAAAQAKAKALVNYRARPEVDPAVMADRKARREARDAAVTERRETIRRAKIELEEQKREQERHALVAAADAAKAEAEAAAQAKADAKAQGIAERKLWTEEDRKAARDARYAARKMRQTRR